MIPVVVVSPRYIAAMGAHLGAVPTRAFARFSLDGIPDSNFAYWLHPTETLW